MDKTHWMNKIVKLFLVFLIGFGGSYHSIGQSTDSTTNTKPTAAEIIKAVEDTIGVDIEELSQSDIERLKERALQLQGVSVKEEIKGQTGGGNSQSNQQSNKQLIDEVKEATEKVEKLVETASDDLRQGAPKVDIFGFNYIQEREVKLFNSALDVKPPDHYIIGAGDEISVNIWGYSDYNEVFTVEKEGYIQPRFVGRVYIKGLTVTEAKEVLTSTFARIYDLENSKFDITINYSRVITVNVVGEVLNPGSYTLPAINSAFNILAYVGGPSKIGSLRNVQIKREGQIIDRFDLYKFLFNPGEQNELFLQNNDYLYVPVAQKVVEIVGEVARPGKYELLQREDFDDLLKYSAGYLPTSYTKTIQIKRYKDNNVFIFDVDLDSLRSANGKLILEDGDKVIVRKITNKIENVVNIKGPVFLPGRYQWKPNYFLSDLIKDAEGLKEDAYLGEAYITRTNDDFTKFTIKVDLEELLANPKTDKDVELSKRDVVELFSETYFYDKFNVSIKGAVRNPREFDLQEGMTLRDLIQLAGGLQKYAYLQRGYITRYNRDDKTTDYLSFEIDTSNGMEALNNYIIQGNDKVRILSNLDFVKDGRLKIEGSVKNPGVYELWKEISLKDLILISGGLNENAYLNRAFVFRQYDNLKQDIIPVFLDTSNYMAALDSVILRRNDEVRIFSNQNYKTSFPIEVNGLVRNPGVQIYRENLTLADAIMLAGGLKFEASNHRIEIARVSNFEESVAMDVPIEIELLYVDADVNLLDDKAANDFKIHPFDQIFIRKTPGFEFQEKVYISGEVKYPGGYVLAHPDEKLTDIIERAGGLTPYAFADGAKLNREDRKLGTVFMDLERAMRRKGSKYNYTLKEGDVINIPRVQELVTVTGTVAFPFIDADSTVSGAYLPGKRARYYVKKYGTGFTKRSFKRRTYVVYANGQVAETKVFFGKIFPKVEQGATIHVPFKAPKVKRERGTRDGQKTLTIVQSIIATSTSAITLYLLIDRAIE